MCCSVTTEYEYQNGRYVATCGCGGYTQWSVATPPSQPVLNAVLAVNGAHLRGSAAAEQTIDTDPGSEG